MLQFLETIRPFPVANKLESSPRRALMRRRGVNQIHQQNFHVSAMGLDIVILRSTPSVSTVRLLSEVLRLLPDPEDWAP